VNLIGSVRAIRVLSEVAAHGSFSAAGAALGLTQSAVSQHVAALERETGLPLVQRGTRPVELTDAGHVLTRHGRALAARLEAAEHDLAEVAGRRSGRLRLGAFPTALSSFVPPALARLRAEQPAAVFTVVDDHMPGLLTRLVDGEFDLAVVFDHGTPERIGPERVRRTHLFDDAFRAVLPAGHRLARRRAAPTLADLADETWIGGQAGSVWFGIVRDACRAAGFEPRTALASDDYRAVQAFVAAGLGVSVIPGLAVVNPTPGIEVRVLRTASPVRRISAAQLDDGVPRPVVQAMITALRATTRGLSQRARAAPRPA